MKRRILRAVAALALCAAAPIAWSAGWGTLLLNGPAEDFHDEDARLFMEALRKTLESPVSKDPLEWSNPDSGAGGSMAVVGQPQRKGFDECRRVRMTVYSRKRKGTPSSWTACKEPAGRWVLVSAG